MINSGEWGLLCLFLLRATRQRRVPTNAANQRLIADPG